MSKLNELKQQAAEHLAASSGFAGAKILTAFPSRERDYPLRQAVVAVGIDTVELSPGSFGGYFGESAAEVLCGGTAQITLRFDLYCPAKESGDRLHGLYEALCGALMVDQNPFGVTKLSCGEIAFDSAAAANRMTARATLPAALLRSEEENRFTAVRIQTTQKKE